MNHARLSAGLHKYKTNSGEVCYFIDFQYGGRRRYSWLGNIPRETAELLAQEYRDGVIRGQLGLARAPVIAAIPKLREAADHYTAKMARKGKDSTTFTKNVHRAFDSLGDRTVDSITENDIETLLDQLLKTYSARTAKNTLSDLSSLLEFSRKKGWVLRNPVPVTASSITVKKRERFEWHPAHDDRLLSAMKTPAERAAFLLGVDAGLRISSVVSIRCDEITVRVDEHGYEFVKMKISTLKGGKDPEYKTSYSKRLIQSLKDQLEVAKDRKSAWLLPAKSTPTKHLTRVQVLFAFQSIAFDVFHRRIWFHDLRHIYVTRAKALIENQNVVKASASHESDRASNIYTHLNSDLGSELSKDSMRQFADRLDALRDQKHPVN